MMLRRLMDRISMRAKRLRSEPSPSCLHAVRSRPGCQKMSGSCARAPSRIILAVGVLLIVGSGLPSPAASVILKIKAANPSQTDAQKLEIKTYLPARIAQENVVSLGGLQLAYDINQALCYVHGEVELQAKEVRTIEIELQDIWVIPDSTVNDLRAHARQMVELLKGTPNAPTSEELWQAIDRNLTSLLERQNKTTVFLVKPIEHIAAYESNDQLLTRVKEDVGVLENLVVGSGKNPGQLVGAARSLVAPDTGRGVTTNTDTVTIKIQVQNTSPTEKRTIPVRRDLPAEVMPDDVADAGGLEVGYDSAKQLTYVHSDGIELAPRETRLFEVRVKNKWAVNEAKVALLVERANRLLAVTRDAEGPEAVIQSIEAALKDLDALRQGGAAQAITPERVASFRDDLRKLNVVENRIFRLEQMLRTAQKQTLVELPNVPRPERRTTWVIIYSILIFLGVVSLLFFLRWYGRPKGEL